MKTILTILALVIVSITVSANTNINNNDPMIPDQSEVLTEVVNEPAIKLEKWMLDMDSFINVTETSESKVELESWMLDKSEWKLAK
ncbi:MAG: hypothetical protein JXB49_34180 [Bacteroidales bacterium]|nr:hypothetical protein [Bacteroidales bacterium]